MSTGRPLARVDAGRAARQHRRRSRGARQVDARAVARCRAILLVDGIEEPHDEDGAATASRRASRVRLARCPPSAVVLICAGDDERWRAVARQARVLEVRCELTSFATRVALWTDAARAETLALTDSELQSLAGRFALTPGQIRRTFATARDLATIDGAEHGSGAADVARRRGVASRSGARAARAQGRAQHGWDDLVLPPATLPRLRELAAAIRHRHVVYGEWGFGERIVTGTGIKALFAGASGTGKTMAAGVIASELGLDLYKIDLSGVVSKYIGETEKNLDRIFHAARAANAIAVPRRSRGAAGQALARSRTRTTATPTSRSRTCCRSSRSTTASSSSRPTCKRNIDDAFARRMHYVVEFPLPDEPHRERLWRGMFPPRCRSATTSTSRSWRSSSISPAATSATSRSMPRSWRREDGGVIGMTRDGRGAGAPARQAGQDADRHRFPAIPAAADPGRRRARCAVTQPAPR